MRLYLLGIVIGVAACGGDDSTGSGAADAAGSGVGSDAATIDSPPALFALTSPTITEGGVIPLTHVCTNQGGMNLSPQLAFANVPAGTMSFAVVLTDLTNSFVHSAIYDIPSTATALPADVEKVYAPTDVPGAHQTVSISGGRGYAGPCPGTVHTYQFKVYALATATLPGSVMSTSRTEVVTAAATNLGTATLTATYTPP